MHEIGEKTRLFNAIVKQKLQYFGHIARREGDNLEKPIMFGFLEGKRGRGRQKLDGLMELKLLKRGPHTVVIQELKIKRNGRT